MNVIGRLVMHIFRMANEMPNSAIASRGSSGDEEGIDHSLLADRSFSAFRASIQSDSQRLARLGLVANALLALVKLLAGVLGNAFALVADAIESSVDMVGSLVVWSGLRIASRNPDERYPFGYGRAEAIAGAVVGVLMLGAAVGISVEAVREIHAASIGLSTAPAPWTLIVLTLAMVTKELLAKRGMANSEATGSTAMAADATHHRSDVVTSAAAFVGISAAWLGGPGWEQADDWAALFAAVVICVNAGLLLRNVSRDLMDRAPGQQLYDLASRAALETSGVLAIEKLNIRKSGTAFYVDIHVQADPLMSLHEAHILSGRVKSAIRRRIPAATGVLIHMEPFEPLDSHAQVGPLGPGRPDGSATSPYHDR